MYLRRRGGGGDEISARCFLQSTWRERKRIEECDVITLRSTGGPSDGSENGFIKPFILSGKINLTFYPLGGSGQPLRQEGKLWRPACWSNEPAESEASEPQSCTNHVHSGHHASCGGVTAGQHPHCQPVHGDHAQGQRRIMWSRTDIQTQDTDTSFHWRGKYLTWHLKTNG